MKNLLIAVLFITAGLVTTYSIEDISLPTDYRTVTSGSRDNLADNFEHIEEKFNKLVDTVDNITASISATINSDESVDIRIDNDANGTEVFTVTHESGDTLFKITEDSTVTASKDLTVSNDLTVNNDLNTNGLVTAALPDGEDPAFTISEGATNLFEIETAGSISSITIGDPVGYASSVGLYGNVIDLNAGAINANCTSLYFQGSGDKVISMNTGDFIIDFDYSDNFVIRNGGSSWEYLRMEHSANFIRFGCTNKNQKFEFYGSGDFHLYPTATSGITPTMKISGYRTGDALRTATFQISSSANNTLNIGGVGTYDFDGAIISDNITVGSGSGLVLSTSGVYSTVTDNSTNWDAAYTHVSADGKDHSDVVLNNTHRTSDGTDHSYINQDVTSSGSPTFDDITATGNIEGDSLSTGDETFKYNKDSFTGEYTQFAGSSTLYKTVYYTRIGGVVTLTGALVDSVSDNTQPPVLTNLPLEVTPLVESNVVICGRDNSTDVLIAANVKTDGTIVFYNGTYGTGFTASNNKGIKPYSITYNLNKY